MKRHWTLHWTLNTIAGISAMLVVQAHGIEAPADDSPPPAIAGPVTDAVPQNQAYIGIVSEPIPEILTAHLGVQPGQGVLVKAVMPDGPAHKAGIGVHDIITQIGDNSIHSAEDLSREVRAHQPGEIVELHLIQKGKAATAKVTLGHRPAHVAGHRIAPLEQLDSMGIPDEMAQRMRDMIEGNLQHFDMRRMDPGSRHPDIDKAFEEMRRRMQESFDSAPRTAPDGGIQFQQNATIRMLDQEGSIEITSSNGIRQLTVRDPDHKVVWQGAWTTDEDKAAAPQDIRKRVERLNLDQSLDGSGFKLKFHRPDH